MTTRRAIEAGAYLVGAAILAWAWVALVPASVQADPWNPAHFSALAAVAGVLGIVLVRLFLAGRERLERFLLASILTFMPLIYLWAALLEGDAQDVAVEVAGLVVFGGISIYGYLRSTLVLALGIAAHGLLWDAWHHGHAAYIAAWYPLGCAAFDVAFGMMIVAYLWARPARNPA